MSQWIQFTFGDKREVYLLDESDLKRKFVTKQWSHFAGEQSTKKAEVYYSVINQLCFKLTTNVTHLLVNSP